MTVTALPTPPAPGPRWRPETALVGAVDAVAAEVPADLPGVVALQRARVLLAESERLRVVALAALADVDTRGLAALDAAPSTAAWVAGLEVAGLDRREVALARRLPTSPAVRGALLAGRLGRDAAARVAAALRRAGPFLDRPDGLVDGQPGEPVLAAVGRDGVLTLLAEQVGGLPATGPAAAAHARLRARLDAVVRGGGSQRDRLETCLVAFAEHADPVTLRGGLPLLLDALLPAEHEARAAHAEQAAGVELVPDADGGGWTLTGRLDETTGELLHTVLRAAADTDPGTPDDTQAWREAVAGPHAADLTGPGALPPADWPTGVTRPRGRAARALAGLRVALRRLLDTTALGSRDKAAPHLSVTVDLAWLHARPGALPPRAASGQPLSRAAVRGLACGALLTRLVLSAGRRVIEASHTTRTATAAERHLLHAEWAGRCAARGCPRGTARADRLIPHHADPWTSSRRTALANTVLLCEADHHALHHHDQHLALRDGRVLGPTGWTHPGPPRDPVLRPGDPLPPERPPGAASAGEAGQHRAPGGGAP